MQLSSVPEYSLPTTDSQDPAAGVACVPHSSMPDKLLISQSLIEKTRTSLEVNGKFKGFKSLCLSINFRKSFYSRGFFPFVCMFLHRIFMVVLSFFLYATEYLIGIRNRREFSPFLFLHFIESHIWTAFNVLNLAMVSTVKWSIFQRSVAARNWLRTPSEVRKVITSKLSSTAEQNRFQISKSFPLLQSFVAEPWSLTLLVLWQIS